MIKALTLRNLPPELAARLEEEAHRTGASLGATVIRLLQRAMLPDADASSKPKRFHDLDFLAGTWSKEEADEFDRYLEEARRVGVEFQSIEFERTKDENAA